MVINQHRASARITRFQKKFTFPILKVLDTYAILDAVQYRSGA